MTDFCAGYEAQRLQTAFKGLGFNAATIIDVFCSHHSSNRVEIAKKYKELFKKDLKSVLKSELESVISNNFYKTCKSMIFYLADYDARQIHKAIKGFIKHEQTLIDVLIPCNNFHITAIKESYKQRYQKDLESDIIGNTKGNFTNVLVAVLQGIRQEAPQPEMVQQHADELYKAGKHTFSTDEDTFNKILCNCSFQHINLIAQDYEARYKKSLTTFVKNKTSSDYKNALLAIITFSIDPIDYYATIFYESMKGLGTDDIRLQRVSIKSFEGNIPAIKKAFLDKYKESLASFIKGDTSGDYMRLLLRIIGEK